ncbi:hypothetical protein ACT3TZ_14630 [Brachybacterium sp. AOP25-B2-12]|uniref:hypothetical protein n=1 Tax=Brachybacterium sp. AOP25-B2-12 TaxID=3457710 RepID=UPI0040346FD7
MATIGRPMVWKAPPPAHVFVDFKAGRAVLRDGRAVPVPAGGRRKYPNLADLLAFALSVDATRVILTGDLPPLREDRPHWMLGDTPGWTHERHQLSREPRVGRYRHDASGKPVELHSAAEWFDSVPVTAEQAREAWEVLTAEVGKVQGWDHHGREIHGSMLYTPASTALNLWGMLLPQKVRQLPTLDADIAEELHATSGQHRIEHLTTTGGGAGENAHEVRHFDAAATPRLDTFAYVDGRFMYSALGWGLGLGAKRLTRDDCAYYLWDPKLRYTRARYLVRATVPKGWAHVGLLPMQGETVDDGWLYPNRPGVTFETWADGAEVMIAMDQGWSIEPIEGVEFEAKGDVLNKWADRLAQMRTAVQGRADLEPIVKRAVAGALRAMLIHGIGTFAKRFRDEDVTVDSPMRIPGEYAHTARRFGDAWVYTRPGREFTDRELGYYHPELAVQIWGRARARMLSAPTGPGYPGKGGLLAMDPGTILGVRGDAVYSSVVPQWALPTNAGGGDDGKNGRLRVKGVLHGVATPLDESERNDLRIKAEAQGEDL